MDKYHTLFTKSFDEWYECLTLILAKILTTHYRVMHEQYYWYAANALLIAKNIEGRYGEGEIEIFLNPEYL